MQREVILTRDGTHTLAIPERKVMYHSIHGAVNESTHVYIKAGLQHAISVFTDNPLTVFEMGFGSGLNALLTAIEVGKANRIIQYTAIETVPLSIAEVAALNYGEALSAAALFHRLHECEWETEVPITPSFHLRKQKADLFNYTSDRSFHVIYYDAFAPSAQPELWTQAVFEKLRAMLVPDGILVTYCAKGVVKRAMKAAGFEVSHLPGPPGKREMLRAKR